MKIQENSKKNLEQEIQAFKNEVCITRGRWKLEKDKSADEGDEGRREEESRGDDLLLLCRHKNKGK